MITWATKKNGDTYEGIISRVTPRATPNAIGHYADTEVLKVVMAASRDTAKRKALEWVHYFKALG